jgi:hypothetical protein
MIRGNSFKQAAAVQCSIPCRKWKHIPLHIHVKKGNAVSLYTYSLSSRWTCINCFQEKRDVFLSIKIECDRYSEQKWNGVLQWNSLFADALLWFCGHQWALMLIFSDKNLLLSIQTHCYKANHTTHIMQSWKVFFILFLLPIHLIEKCSDICCSSGAHSASYPIVTGGFLSPG